MDSQEIKAEERNAIFGEITSLDTVSLKKPL